MFEYNPSSPFVFTQEIDKLPDLEKVDCVTLSLAPFKAWLDDVFLRTGDLLLIALRRSLMEEFKEVDAYLEGTRDILYSTDVHVWMNESIRSHVCVYIYRHVPILEAPCIR